MGYSFITYLFLLKFFLLYQPEIEILYYRVLLPLYLLLSRVFKLYSILR